jgi:two-component system, chemotaxis family, CheB/CheR fusion protein
MAQTEVSQDFETLLEFIRTSRGFDFTGYKRPSLLRRISKRMAVVGVDGFDAYRDYLELHPEEFVDLFDTIMINVTSFFRDPQTWEFVAAEIVPKLVLEKAAVEPIRAWSTGCATGEEAYTVAMVLAEELGEEAFRNRVKIYATDVDDAALTLGRHATYSQKQMEPVPPPYRQKYFEQTDAGFIFRRDLRRSVIFGRNDLVQDPPISRIDLLVSRNTLMYFTPETQGRVLSNFYFALNDPGYLLLGKSEVLLTRSNLFVPADLKRRVFQRAQRAHIRERLLTLAREHEDGGPPSPSDSRIRDSALEAGPVAQIVVSLDGHLVLANQQARTAFNLSSNDLDRPFSDAELSFRPIELRSLIERARADGHSVNHRDVEWRTASGEERNYDVQVAPMTWHDGTVVGTSVTFADVTRYRRLHETLERSKHELETAYEELQATAEELETTNEELQSTNEELETTNEELQSTNEELETMNEELQSTNEELETINDELRSRTDDLHEVNAFLESILSSFHAGVAVVDADLVVQAWNDRAADMWGLRQDEVAGQHLLNLDIGLSVGALRDPLRASLGGEPQRELVLEATNRRGRAISCAVTISPLRGSNDEARGAIILMEEREAS